MSAHKWFTYLYVLLINHTKYFIICYSDLKRMVINFAKLSWVLLIANYWVSLIYKKLNSVGLGGRRIISHLPPPKVDVLEISAVKAQLAPTLPRFCLTKGYYSQVITPEQLPKIHSHNPTLQSDFKQSRPHFQLTCSRVNTLELPTTFHHHNHTTPPPTTYSILFTSRLK